MYCSKCGTQIEDDSNFCFNCGYQVQGMVNENIDDYSPTKQQTKFNGVYRSLLFGGLQEVYCPRCKSSDCSHFQEQQVVPAKTKTSYKANLNPLKPFTLVNKKEKTKRKEQTYYVDKFVCNKCGKIFR